MPAVSRPLSFPPEQPITSFRHVLFVFTLCLHQFSPLHTVAYITSIAPIHTETSLHLQTLGLAHHALKSPYKTTLITSKMNIEFLVTRAME